MRDALREEPVLSKTAPKHDFGTLQGAVPSTAAPGNWPQIRTLWLVAGKQRAYLFEPASAGFASDGLRSVHDVDGFPDPTNAQTVIDKQVPPSPVLGFSSPPNWDGPFISDVFTKVDLSNCTAKL